MPTLAELPFIDLYMRLDENDTAYYRGGEGEQGELNQVLPEIYHQTIQGFIASIQKCLGSDNDASLTYEGVRCRISRQFLSDGSVWVCARRIESVVPRLAELGYAPHIHQQLHALGRRDGLILISGSTGQGKTTTGVALLDDYMRTYGGAAITIEDPVEYVFKGHHGDHARCFQVEVRSDDEWAINIKRSLRWTPRYIFVGEIRTSQAAEQLLRAATTGHTVITTVHAGTPEEALMGILFYAEQAMGDRAKEVLATALTALVHQQMTPKGLNVRYLCTEEKTPGDPVRALIRDNKIGMLSTYIDRIEARLLNQGTAHQGASHFSVVRKH